jgi:signal transduction histidine kinase
MRLLSSLTNRIFLASAALAVLCIGAAVYFVNVRVTRQAEAELERGLVEAGRVVEEHRTTLSETFILVARLVADLPKLKAAVETGDPPTVQPIAADYQSRVKSDLCVVTSREGAVLASVGPAGRVAGRDLPVRTALEGGETTSFHPHPDGILQVVTVPISIGAAPPEIMGTLSLGFVLDDAVAARFGALTESEVAFALDGAVRAATLPLAERTALAPLAEARGVSRLPIDGVEYVAVSRPLAPPRPGGSTAAAVILRSRTERLRFLDAIHTALAGTALLAVLVATVLSYAVARTVTRPLAKITAAMREMSTTGDLTRKIRLEPAHWEDEDAGLLARTFNTLTDSIAAFQRDAAQRERLSALGRLSTVVAHEVRNPLMIIKASLRVLRQAAGAPPETREAVADIDEEVSRLDRVVNEVLDFARPIRCELGPTDLNALCRSAAEASLSGEAAPGIALRLDPALPRVMTDGERVRTALVNILSNAREAVAARGGDLPAGSGTPPGDAGPDVELSTLRAEGAVAIVIADRGIGSAAADLPHVFDPYFTTRRTGTGLGLAIAKNIVEALGGVITVRNRPSEGTEVRIDLPASAVIE